MLLKITFLLKSEEESELSVSRQKLLEKSVPATLQLTVTASGQYTSHVHSQQTPQQATAAPSQTGCGSSC